MSLRAVITLGLAALAVGCTRPSDGEVRIGQFGSFTGPEATFGQATDRGVRLAVDARNAAGGINGRRVVLYTEDNQGKAEDTVSLVKKLVGQSKVVALLGEVASTRSLAAASIAQQLGIPMISPSSTDPDVTKDRDFVFGTCFIDPVQGPILARFAAQDLKMKRVAILRDSKSDYSLGLTEFFTKTFESLGGKVVASLDYASGDPDFKAQLTKIRALDPEGLFVPGYYNDVGPIARQARELGIKARFIGGDGWGNPKLPELSKGAVEGAYFANFYSSDNPSPATTKYAADYRARYGHDSDPLAAAGFDAAGILMTAIERASEPTPRAIRDQIAKIHGYKGATGTTTINAGGNADKDVFVVQIRGTSNKHVKTFTK